MGGLGVKGPAEAASSAGPELPGVPSGPAAPPTTPGGPPHPQPVHHGTLEMRRAALSPELCPGGRLLCDHVRRQALPLPRDVHLHPPPGGAARHRDAPRGPARRGHPGWGSHKGSCQGGHEKPQPSVLTAPPPQSPQLPDGASLMAVYDKSGYSHSETSLVALIYMSSQVRPRLQLLRPPRSPGGRASPPRPPPAAPHVAAGPPTPGAPVTRPAPSRTKS